MYFAFYAQWSMERDLAEVAKGRLKKDDVIDNHLRTYKEAFLQVDKEKDALRAAINYGLSLSNGIFGADCRYPGDDEDFRFNAQVARQREEDRRNREEEARNRGRGRGGPFGGGRGGHGGDRGFGGGRGGGHHSGRGGHGGGRGRGGGRGGGAKGALPKGMEGGFGDMPTFGGLTGSSWA